MTKLYDHEIVVIGAGPGGIAAGVKLIRAGLDDFVILERADDVGGSWHENHYPGLSVDIPALAYQYSFARKADWSRVFPRGAEVKAYHVEVARRFGLYPHLRFGTEVTRQEWDENRHVWRLHLAGGGEVTARYVISAVGAFVNPKADPGIPGLLDYHGKLQRPSDWDDDYDYRGKRVAVIGTGASSVQIVPALARSIASLTVFQRTPVWSLPKPDAQVPAAVQSMLRIPGVQAGIHGGVLVAVDLVLRAGVTAPMWLVRPALRTLDNVAIGAYRRYLRRVVRDPETAAALTPNYGPIAKRPTMSGFTFAFNRDNVALVTDPIRAITATGIETGDGTRHEFDMIVLATGYEVFCDPETYRPGMIVGTNGFDLSAFYNEQGLQAYQSVALPRLPNRWMLVGPYSWTGSGWHAFVEMTADHAVRAITEARRRQATRVEVRQSVHDAYHQRIHRRAAFLRYYLAELNAHVPTYYRNSQGDSTYIRPSGFFEARRGNQRFPLDDYEYTSLQAVLVSGRSNGKATTTESATA
ncbi:NAD(P)/FAD-dependent oxidoreductase [Nocardia sp. XZ_19_385]|uniref:flavin-containing monooxygenase n=1 Tax=Nocardia sp. XZ_19_385 TaxID=2769488 RepID=UPI0018903AE5|nr:NAD(P)/FAD-dependent oxidoreductase [Nocardia sp. XZ_19_385]